MDATGKAIVAIGAVAAIVAVRRLVRPQAHGGKREETRVVPGTALMPDFDGASHRRRILTSVAGLHNLGNTCFMNAVLQALAATPPMLRWFRTVKRTLKSGKTPAKGVDDDVGEAEATELFTELLVSTTESLASLHPADESTLYPSDVLKRFTKYFEGSNNQQDAQEFLHLLMNVVDSEEWAPAWKNTCLPLAALAESYSAAHNDPRYPPRGVGLKSLEELKAEHGFLTASSEHQNPMLGWTGVSTCCPCGRVAPWRNESFFTLSMAVKPTIQQCLSTFSFQEWIADYKCEKCNQRGTMKRGRITRLPHVLCLHLQRRTVSQVTGAYVKVARKVSFPMVLDMAPFVSIRDDPMLAAARAGRVTTRRTPMKAGRRSADATGAGVGAGAGDGAGAGSGRGVALATQPKHDRVGSGGGLGSVAAASPGSTGCVGGTPDAAPRPSPPTSPAAAGGPTTPVAERTRSAGSSLHTATPPPAPSGPRPPVNPYPRGFSNYVLMSVIRHLGGPDSGHYVTYRRKPRIRAESDLAAVDGGTGGGWVMVSDAQVRDVPEAAVLAAEAYMLFYLRLDKAIDTDTGKGDSFEYDVMG